MSSHWHSLPLRDKTGIDDVRANQKTRAKESVHPMSSPLRKQVEASAKDRIRQELKNLRNSVREAKTELKRERVVHDESAEKRIRDLEAEAAVLVTDLDLLIEEENTAAEKESAADYGEELEEYLAQEELELEAQLKELSLL